MTNYDIIVIGSGVNSLVAAAMMAKAGKKVLVLESREEIGGLASTNEFAPGFKCNTINDTIKWVDPRIIKELEIQSKDLELIDIDIKRIALGAGENELIIFHKDPLLTSESIANHSENDAKKWKDFTIHIEKLTKFLEKLYQLGKESGHFGGSPKPWIKMMSQLSKEELKNNMAWLQTLTCYKLLIDHNLIL